MRITLNIILLTLFFSCSTKEFTLEQYANYPVKFAKQKISYPNNDFSLFIPKNWEWKIEEYDDNNIILGIDAFSQPDKNGFIDIISIQKIKSFGNKKDLKSEFDYCSDLLKRNWKNAKVIETGETKILNQKAYFLHTKSNTQTYGEAEIISLILESETNGIFYNLNAIASKTNDIKLNMSILVQSLKTFENNLTE